MDNPTLTFEQRTTLSVEDTKMAVRGRGVEVVGEDGSMVVAYGGKVPAGDEKY